MRNKKLLILPALFVILVLFTNCSYLAKELFSDLGDDDDEGEKSLQLEISDSGLPIGPGNTAFIRVYTDNYLSNYIYDHTIDSPQTVYVYDLNSHNEIYIGVYYDADGNGNHMDSGIDRYIYHYDQSSIPVNEPLYLNGDGPTIVSIDLHLGIPTSVGGG